jgi:hypothetical protein
LWKNLARAGRLLENILMERDLRRGDPGDWKEGVMTKTSLLIILDPSRKYFVENGLNAFGRQHIALQYGVLLKASCSKANALKLNLVSLRRRRWGFIKQLPASIVQRHGLNEVIAVSGRPWRWHKLHLTGKPIIEPHLSLSPLVCLPDHR